MARPCPSRSGNAHDGFAYVYLRTQHLRRKSASWGAKPLGSCSEGDFTRFGDRLLRFLKVPNDAADVSSRQFLLPGYNHLLFLAITGEPWHNRHRRPQRAVL